MKTGRATAEAAGGCARLARRERLCIVALLNAAHMLASPGERESV